MRSSGCGEDVAEMLGGRLPTREGSRAGRGTPADRRIIRPRWWGNVSRQEDYTPETVGGRQRTWGLYSRAGLWGDAGRQEDDIAETVGRRQPNGGLDSRDGGGRRPNEETPARGWQSAEEMGLTIPKLSFMTFTWIKFTQLNRKT